MLIIIISGLSSSSSYQCQLIIKKKTIIKKKRLEKEKKKNERKREMERERGRKSHEKKDHYQKVLMLECERERETM